MDANAKKAGHDILLLFQIGRHYKGLLCSRLKCSLSSMSTVMGPMGIIIYVFSDIARKHQKRHWIWRHSVRKQKSRHFYSIVLRCSMKPCNSAFWWYSYVESNWNDYVEATFIFNCYLMTPRTYVYKLLFIPIRSLYSMEIMHILQVKKKVSYRSLKDKDRPIQREESSAPI